MLAQSFTFVVGGEAEHVVVVLVLLSQAVVADARHRVLASAGFPGCVDGILHRAVAQPARVTPVHASSPRIVQLVKGRHDGILVATRPLSIIEIEVVAPKAGEVRENNAYVES